MNNIMICMVIIFKTVLQMADIPLAFTESSTENRGNKWSIGNEIDIIKYIESNGDIQRRQRNTKLSFT